MSRSKLPEYRLHCHSSRNNTIVSFTKPNGSTIAWLSGGSTPNKFRKANRATYEAGYQCAVGIFQKIKEWNKNVEPIKLELFFKGFGEGREAMKTAMLAVEGEEIRKLVCSITDRTPIKIGGTRSKKQRRG
jgi:small subunit ribosomal protein S11